jgi:hypothetical protein
MNHLTTTQLAERWQMDEKTLSHWRQQGRGPQYIKLGEGKTAVVRYRLEDIQAFEQTNLRTSP